MTNLMKIPRNVFVYLNQSLRYCVEAYALYSICSFLNLTIKGIRTNVGGFIKFPSLITLYITAQCTSRRINSSVFINITHIVMIFNPGGPRRTPSANRVANNIALWSPSAHPCPHGTPTHGLFIHNDNKQHISRTENVKTRIRFVVRSRVQCIQARANSFGRFYGG